MTSILNTSREKKKVADALSQWWHINAISRSQFDLLDQVNNFQQEDPYCKSIRENTSLCKDFVEKYGIIYFKDRLVILEKDGLKNLIM